MKASRSRYTGSFLGRKIQKVVQNSSFANPFFDIFNLQILLSVREGSCVEKMKTFNNKQRWYQVGYSKKMQLRVTRVPLMKSKVVGMFFVP